MKFLGRLLGVMVIGVVVVLLGLTAKAQDYKRVSLTVSGDQFSVELAKTPEERQRGLMFRKSLGAEQGMLFDFEVTSGITMWMKNTFIPLDMVFISEDGVIRRIEERTVPHSLEIIASGTPVRFVLEVNGGTADRLGWAIGDMVSDLPR